MLSRYPRLRIQIAYAVVLVLGLLLGWRIAYGNLSGWGVDFNQFYAASHLAGTGNLYNWDALQHEELKNGLVGHTARLPVVAYGVKLVSWLPFDVAHWVWVISSAVAFVLTAFLWPGRNRAVYFLVLAWSLPAALTLLLGQDTPFWLLFFGAGFALLQRGRFNLAGILLALCLCKFHLAAGIPIVLMARKCWQTLFSGALTCCVFLGVSFLIEGPHWPARYMEIFSAPRMSPAPERMPNLRGLSHWIPHPSLVQTALVVICVALLWFAARQTANVGLLAAMAAATGLVIAPHGYGNDCVLLIPLVAFWISDKSAPAFIRVGALLIMSPIPLLLLVSDKPLAGQILIVGFVLLTLLTAKSAERPGVVHSH